MWWSGGAAPDADKIVIPYLQRVSDPTATMGANAVESIIFPACAVIRTAAKRAQEKANETSVTVDTGPCYSLPNQSLGHRRWHYRTLSLYEATTIDPGTTA